VHLEATNADSTAGGVALKNLKYRVSIDSGSVAKPGRRATPRAAEAPK